MPKIDGEPGKAALALYDALQSGNQGKVDALLEFISSKWGLGTGSIGALIAGWALNIY